MALKRREELEGRAGRDVGRMARRGGSSLVYTLLVVAAVIAVLIVSRKLGVQHDLSRQGTNRLSPQTLAVLSKLDTDVELFALYRKDAPVIREAYWSLLKKYRMRSSRLKAEFYDPITRPGIVKALGLNPEQEGLGTEGLTVAVRVDPEVPLAKRDKVLFRGRDEEAVTNAILELGREGEPVVGLLRGYGERDPSSDAGGGLSAAVEALKGEYYAVRDVLLGEGIPPDTSVLVLAGPRLPIPQADLDLLAEWLERGGRLLTLLDPGADTGINRVLDRWGLRVNGDRIHDQREHWRRDPFVLRVTQYSKVNPVVKGFGKNFPTAFPVASSVADYEPGDPLVFHDSLADSSHFSMAVAEDGTRTPGPLSVAAASWKEERIDGKDVVTRLVLVGDSDFATNAHLPAGANRNFLLNAVGWLSRQAELVSVRRQRLGGQKFSIDREERRVLYAAVFGAPALLLIAGVAVFLRRRGL